MCSAGATSQRLVDPKRRNQWGVLQVIDSAKTRRPRRMRETVYVAIGQEVHESTMGKQTSVTHVDGSGFCAGLTR